MTPTPDWLTTVLPFITLLIGAGVTFMLSTLTDKRRTNREDEQRWHELVRTLSAAVFAHARRITDIAQEHKEWIDDSYDDSIPHVGQLAGMLIKEKRAIQDKASEIAIIVPFSFSSALITFVYNVTESTNDEASIAEPAKRQLEASRRELMREVREYLGLPSDPVQ